MQGHTLKPILEGKADQVRDASYYHFYSHGDNNLPEIIGIRTSTHKLIHYPGMKAAYQWELFDLQADPSELNNRYHSPLHKDIRKELKTQLRQLIKDLADPVQAPALTTTQNLQP